jgi:hypothetical protein
MPNILESSDFLCMFLVVVIIFHHVMCSFNLCMSPMHAGSSHELLLFFSVLLPLLVRRLSFTYHDSHTGCEVLTIQKQLNYFLTLT